MGVAISGPIGSQDLWVCCSAGGGGAGECGCRDVGFCITASSLGAQSTSLRIARFVGGGGCVENGECKEHGYAAADTMFLLMGVGGLVIQNRLCMLIPAILRVYQLLRNVPRLGFFVSFLLVSRALVYLLMVLVLLLLVAAETGRYMVNTNFEGRQHFDTLPHRMPTCFVLFTGDNWSEIMVEGMASKTTAFRHLVVALYILA